jgi:integrase
MGAAHKLSPAKVTQIARAKPRGLYGDGKGLWLQVSAFGTTAWLFRYMMAGKARGMGLGPYPDVTLKEARELADDARKLVRSGVDPIEERKAKKIAAQVEAAKQVTFAKCVEEYLAAHSKSWRNAKHRDQWKSTLETYANPIIGKLPVAAVDTALVLKILRPIWDKKPETASRLRGRIERVLAWATVSTYRSGENPARWHGHLKEMLPSKSKVRKPVHHKALPYADTPAFMSKLRYEESVSAKALEFTILNATRTNETIGAKWSEIDLAAKVWTIPAARMKMDRPHRVPLSDRAVAILADLPRDGDYVFPGAREGKPLSNMAMLELVRGMLGHGYTVHGFRSSFRDWCKEQTNYPREIAELALAHVVADKSEAAYSRGDALDKRRPLMRDWSAYCQRKPQEAGKVIGINEARA